MDHNYAIDQNNKINFKVKKKKRNQNIEHREISKNSALIMRLGSFLEQKENYAGWDRTGDDPFRRHHGQNLSDKV
jgi:hypothetical protein